MLAAVEKKKEKHMNAYDISAIKRVARNFFGNFTSHCSGEKQRQRNVQKKCAARAKLIVAN